MAMQFVSAFCIYGALELESTARRTILRENFRWSHGCIWTFSRRSDWFCWSGIPPRRKQNNVSARRLESLQQDRLPGGSGAGPHPRQHVETHPRRSSYGQNRGSTVTASPGARPLFRPFERLPGNLNLPSPRGTDQLPQNPILDCGIDRLRTLTLSRLQKHTLSGLHLPHLHAIKTNQPHRSTKTGRADILQVITSTCCHKSDI